MRSILLIGNKEERFLIRNLMKDLGDIIAPASFEEALQQFKLQPQPVLTAIIDERFEQRFASQSIAQATADISRSQMTCSEFIEEVKKLGVIQPQTQYAVILADDRHASQALIYSEMGADLVLVRPLGSQDIKDKFENFFQLVRNPPAAVRMIKFLRGLVDAKKYQDAFNALTKFLALDPKNLVGQLLYAKTLLNLGPEKFGQGIEQLQLLDTQFEKSILVKTLLREAFLKKEKYLDAYACSEKIYEIDATRAHFSDLIISSESLFAQRLDETIFQKWVDKFLPQGIPQKKRELVSLYEKWFFLVTEDFSWLRLKSLMDSFEKTLPPKYFDEAELKKSLVLPIMKLFEKSRLSKPQKNEGELISDFQVAFQSLIGHLLDVDPQNGMAILELVELAQIQTDIRKITWARLETSLGGVGSISNLSHVKATQPKRGPLEAYLGVAILGLADGLMKEASDAIFAGKRISPNDTRLEALSLEWRKAYDAKQASQ
jgi:hypothetical protein